MCPRGPGGASARLKVVVTDTAFEAAGVGTSRVNNAWYLCWMVEAPATASLIEMCCVVLALSLDAQPLA